MSKPLLFYLPKNKTFESNDLIFATFLAHLKRFTGEMKVSTDNGQNVLIMFHHGYITQLISNSKKSFFGNLLVEHGLLLKEDVQSILKNKSPRKSIGEILVEKDLLSPHMLHFILKEQVKIRLSETMVCSSLKIDLSEKEITADNSKNINFSETEFLEWLADALKTDLKTEFLDRFYQNFKHLSIEKSSQINEFVFLQRNFLKDYNTLFKNISPDIPIEKYIVTSENKNYLIRLLLFGLLNKSLYVINKKTAFIDLQRANILLDQILGEGTEALEDSEDLFACLNLPWNASIEEVHKSYKNLVQKIHPDLVPNTIKEKAENAFKKIKKSYEILSDGKKRTYYMEHQKQDNFGLVMKKYGGRPN